MFNHKHRYHKWFKVQIERIQCQLGVVIYPWNSNQWQWINIKWQVIFLKKYFSVVFLLNLLKVNQWKLYSLFHSSFFSAELLLVLRKFGKCNIKWPKNDGTNHNMPGSISFFLFNYTILVFYNRLLSCSISWITFCMWTS